MEKFRSRSFCLLLYPDDPSHVVAIDTIVNNYDCAYILHDKDVMQDGEIKKSHYHFVVNVGKNAVWSTAFSDNLGISSNYIQRCRSLDRSLEYLIHFNEPEKYQYDIDCVHGSLRSRLLQIISSSDKTEGDKVSDLLDFIDNYEGYLKISVFSRYCASVGMWDIFRRSGVIFIKVIDEHNSVYIDREKEL